MQEPMFQVPTYEPILTCTSMSLYTLRYKKKTLIVNIMTHWRNYGILVETISVDPIFRNLNNSDCMFCCCNNIHISYGNFNQVNCEVRV